MEGSISWFHTNFLLNSLRFIAQQYAIKSCAFLRIKYPASYVSIFCLNFDIFSQHVETIDMLAYL